MYSLQKLQKTPNMGKTNESVSWYSVPQYTSSDMKIAGTIYSTKCNKIGYFSGGTCYDCKSLLNMHSFQMKIRRANSEVTVSGNSTDGTLKTVTGKTNNRYLRSDKKGAKLTLMRKSLKRQRLIIKRLSFKVCCARCYREKLKDKIKENSARGDVSAICKNFQQAYDNGSLAGKSKVITFVKTVSQNIVRDPKGRRHSAFTKHLYNALSILGGPRTARFLAEKLCGSSASTLRLHKGKTHFLYYPGSPSLRVFSHLAKLYKNIKEKKKIVGDVLVETAEDETVIVKLAEWYCRKDQGWGWCGREGDDHECDADFVLNLGDNDAAYATLVDAFCNNRLAGFARVIMINPLTVKLPSFVIHLQATCNKFTHEYVRHQHDQIRQLYNEYLLPVLGPLVSHA